MNYPIPLDHLIAYVRGLHPDGGPLDNLSDAVTVSAELDNQADALLGHFVDQARRSGASWTEIGARMEVTKQAARKRFVPRWDASDPIPEGQLYSRFTQRSRNCVGVAARIAQRAGQAEIDTPHLAAGLLSEPEGLAVRIVHAAGLTEEQVGTALGVPPVPVDGDASAAVLREVRFTDDCKEALRGTLAAVLRLGHNYVGTEHLLLGILIAEGATARILQSLGLTVEVVERGITEEIARIQAARGGA